MLRQEAIQQMKLHTRQYVKTQLNWINHKLIPQCHHLGPKKTPIYILDATDPTKWSSKVLNPALSIAQGPLPNNNLANSSIPHGTNPSVAFVGVFRGRGIIKSREKNVAT